MVTMTRKSNERAFLKATFSGGCGCFMWIFINELIKAWKGVVLYPTTTTVVG